MKFHFEDTLPLSLPIYKRCDNIIYENKFNIHAAKFSTFSYFIYWNNLLLRLTFWKVSVSFYLKRMEQPSTKAYFSVWWSCKGVQSFGKRKVLFICSLVRLFVSLRTDDIPLLEQEIMQIHLVANIFFYSHESRFHILMVWQPAIVPNFQRVFFLFHESENTLAFFKRIFSFV